MSTSDEIAKEQAHFDATAEAREVMRGDESNILAGATPRDQAQLLKDFERVSAQLGGPSDPVAFGRIDFADGGEFAHIGFATIWDSAQEVLVVSMKNPTADTFYTSTIADPKGLSRKRTFATTGNRIDSIEDLVFADIIADLERLTKPGTEPPPDDLDDTLLRSLEANRSGEMAEIARTIQAAQHTVVTAPKDQVLIVQGGPGTGKTAVALHRLSWMLFRSKDELAPNEVLVVGPSNTFVRYIRKVLPSLGDRDVRQVDITGLTRGDLNVTLGRDETARVSTIKGEARMAELLRAALWQRVGTTPSGKYSMAFGRRTVTFSHAELDALVTSAGRQGGYASGRTRFRRLLEQMIAERTGNDKAPREMVDQMVERVWPQFTERSFLSDLLGSQNRLVAAAGAGFTVEDIVALVRNSAQRLTDEVWAEADLPLLDEMRWLIDPSEVPSYKHVVVDEAQDLSPMQLRALRRRCSADSMTVVGDLAQSTGLWARDSWDEVAEILAVDSDANIVELDLGYRVPSESFELAARLLPIAAPSVKAPRAVRSAGHPPNLIEAADGQVASSAARQAAFHAGRGNFVGIVCPDVHWDDVERSLKESADRWSSSKKGEFGLNINLISPSTAKGLEFDAVIVVDPGAIVAESTRGLRLLYVALTRTTSYLDVIHTGVVLPGLEDLDEPDESTSTPPILPAPSSDILETSAAREDDRRVPRAVRLMATDVADDVRMGLPPQHWLAFVDELKRQLSTE